METVGFIGTGSMGTPMAINLLKHGYPLKVHNRTKQHAEKVIEEGGEFAEKLIQIAECPVIITMLANDQALEEICTGAEGIISSLKPGAIHISCSTVSPHLIQKLAEYHQEKGAHLLSAPVFGRPEAAKNQELVICLAGNEESKNQVLPILKVLGKKVYDFGLEPSKANITKLCGNFMIASSILMLGEAIALGESHGITPHQFLDFITETMFASPVFKNYGSIIANEKFSPAGFKMKLGFKDLNLFLDTAKESALNLPLAYLLKKQFESSFQKGRDELDWAALSLLSKE